MNPTIEVKSLRNLLLCIPGGGFGHPAQVYLLMKNQFAPLSYNETLLQLISYDETPVETLVEASSEGASF
jgi:hypothetical protein